VYRDLLGRLPDAGGLAFWRGLLDQGLPRSQMVLAIETDSAHEYYSKLVASFYQFYLHRTEGAGDQGAATGLVNFLAAGGAIEQVRAFFTSSPEYFITRGGGTGSCKPPRALTPTSGEPISLRSPPTSEDREVGHAAEPVKRDLDNPMDES